MSMHVHSEDTPLCLPVGTSQAWSESEGPYCGRSCIRLFDSSPLVLKMAQIFVDIWVEGKRWRLPEGERFNLAPFMDQAVEGNGRFTLQDTQDRCRMALDSDCKIWVQGQHRYKVVPVKIEPSAPRGSKDGAATGKSLYMQTEKEAIKASRPDGVHYASHAHECWNKLDQKMKDAWEKRAEEVVVHLP